MRTKFWNCCAKPALLALCAAASWAQTPVVTVEEPAKLVVARTGNPASTLKVSIKPGYHANSNTPSEEYLIPFKLSWEPGAIESVEVVYPKPRMEKYDFSDKPLSVFGGDLEVATKFKRAANPVLGPGFITGKLRFQACNDKMCLPPKTLDVKLPILVQ